MDPQGVWNQKYQVKVDSGAPTGSYRFEIHLQYLENGEPVETHTKNGSYKVKVIKEFTMPVDNEGVDISGNVLKTEPTVPRPGDDYVNMQVEFTNTGNKPLEEIVIRTSTPEDIETSFSDDISYYIDQLTEGQEDTDAQPRRGPAARSPPHRAGGDLRGRIREHLQ